MVRGSDAFLLLKKLKNKTGLRQLYVIAYQRPVKLQKQSRQAYGLKPQRLLKSTARELFFYPQAFFVFFVASKFDC